MWIESVKINDFLVFREVDVRLGPGLNVIVTPNEGGKSSLMTSIVTSLYRDATSRSREMREMRRWGSGSYPRVELKFHTGGEELRLVRDFGEKKQNLFRGTDAAPFRSGREVNDYLRDRLMLPDERLFLRVCAVRHEELGSVSDGELALGERIEEILGGGWGPVNPVKVMKMLEAKRVDLRRGFDRPAKSENWGALKRFSERVAELELELREAEAVERKREELLRALSGKGGDLGRLGLGHMKEKKEKADRFNSLLNEVETAEGRMQDVRKRKERLEKLLAERDDLMDRGRRFFEPLLACDESTLDAYRTGIERETFLASEIEHSRIRGKTSFPLWKGAAAVLLVAGGIAGSILVGKAFYAAVAAGILLAVWTAAVFVAARRGGIPKEMMDELDGLNAERRSWSGGQSLDKSREILHEFGGWKGAVDNLDGRLQEASERVKGGPDFKEMIESLDGEFGRCSARWRSLKDELERLDPFRLDADGMLSLEGEIDRKEKESERLNREIGSMERELMGMPPVDLNVKIEQLASARSNLERVDRRIRIIETVIDALDEARKQIAGLLADRLPPMAGGYLSRITNGRYGDLIIDPVRLKIETAPVEEDTGGDDAPERIAPEVLSQGARDQIYLAVRLALVDLLSEQEPQPVFLDDPLVHFDPERRERALEIILEFAGSHQLLLFTCDPAYKDLGGMIVTLGSEAV